MRERLRGRYPHPDSIDSWIYLVTEVAEVGDVLLQLQNPGHKRTHEMTGMPLEDLLAKELGDVQFMLCTLANHYRVNLEVECISCCLDKEFKYGETSYFEELVKEPWPKLDEEMLKEVRNRAAQELRWKCIYFRETDYEIVLALIQTFFELGYLKGREDALEENPLQ